MFESTKQYNKTEDKKEKNKLKDVVKKVIKQQKEEKELADLENFFAKKTRFSSQSNAERIIRSLHEPNPKKHQRNCKQWKKSIENKCPGYCKRYKTRGCKKRCQELLLEEVEKVANLKCNQPKPKKKLVEYPPLRF